MPGVSQTSRPVGWRPASCGLVLELEQFVYRDDLGLAAELDPDLIQHRHEHVVVEGTLLISGRPDFAHPEAVIVTVQDVKLKSRRREVALFEKPACFVVLLAGHTNFLVSDENAHGRLLFAGSSDSTIGVQRL